MSMLAIAKAVVPPQFFKVMFVFFLERVVVEEFGSNSDLIYELVYIWYILGTWFFNF